MIENEFFKLKAEVEGGEITSIISKKTGKEYIWQADAKYWSSHAPVLFPIIGALKNNKYLFEGKEYEMPKHGIFRRNKDIQIVEQSQHSICFALTSNESTLKQFPFTFQFRVRYSLDKNKVLVEHEVENLGAKTMPFAIGGHPAFNCPEGIENYYIEFEKEENDHAVELSEEGLITDRTKPMLSGKNLELTKSIFDQDALIFKNLNSRSVKLRNTQNENYIQLDFHDFPYLGVWSKPTAPYVCIEPWLGIADHVNTSGKFIEKDNIQLLEQGKTFQNSFAIYIYEN